MNELSAFACNREGQGRPAKGARLDVTVETRDREHADNIFDALDADGYQPVRIEAGDAMA